MKEDLFSYAHIGNVLFLEDLYRKYSEDPESVDLSWRYFFLVWSFLVLFLPSLVDLKAQILESFMLFIPIENMGIC